ALRLGLLPRSLRSGERPALMLGIRRNVPLKQLHGWVSRPRPGAAARGDDVCDQANPGFANRYARVFAVQAGVKTCTGLQLQHVLSVVELPNALAMTAKPST